MRLPVLLLPFHSGETRTKGGKARVSESQQASGAGNHIVENVPRASRESGRPAISPSGRRALAASELRAGTKNGMLGRIRLHAR